MQRKFSIRKLINTLHLWAGIPSALVLFVVCFSGTIYVFNKEITRWVDRDKFYVKTGLRFLPAEKLVAMVENEKQDMRVSFITIPENKDEAWIFASGKKNKERTEPISKGKVARKEREKLISYLVDPYSGTVQGEAQTTTSEFFNTIMQLHRWLLLDHDIGSIITGVAAFTFLFLELTGIILWLPARFRAWKKWNAWRSGFTIKTSANWKRINHDLHKSLGIYTFLIITILAITGPVLGFDWYRKAFNTMLGAKVPQKNARESESLVPKDSLAKPLPVGQWLAKANSVYTYRGDMRITLPKSKLAAVSIIKTKTGFAGADKLTLDQYSNAVIENDRFADKSLGEKIATTVKAIHTGEIFGIVTKIIYFIACLLATSLPITGIFIWINKWRKKQKIPFTDAVKVV